MNIDVNTTIHYFKFGNKKKPTIFKNYNTCAIWSTFMSSKVGYNPDIFLS